MHVLQWVAVEADDVDNAANVAEDLLNQELGTDESSTNTWFDWFVVGGGRWNPEQEPYTNSSNMVISYDKDPNAFSAKIQECVQSRVDEYDRYLEEVKKIDIIDKLSNYGGVMSYDLDMYSLKNLLRFQMGEWFYDSAFFDFTEWSTNATHILSKIDNDKGKNLYLVPIDFHF